MKRRGLVLIAAAAAGMLLLTACTSSENADMQEAGAGTTSAGTQSVGENTVTDAADASDDQGNSSQVADAGTAASADNSAADADPVVDGAAVGDSTETGEQSSGSVDNITDNSTDSNTDDGAVSGEFHGVYQAGPEGSDETEIVTGDIWSGTYGNDDETITITYLDANTISFAFAQSGISGKAAVKGYQAVYNGDDYHVVVFNIHNDIIDVSVSSEEDYDASGSPLIGTYIRDYVSETKE